MPATRSSLPWSIERQARWGVDDCQPADSLLRGCVTSLLAPLDLLREPEYCPKMIRSFRCQDTEALFRDRAVPRFRMIERTARRKLLYLHRAVRLQDLRVPPGNRLESLKGDRKGQHSIRINDQWRICFQWKDGDAFGVEIVDYH